MGADCIGFISGVIDELYGLHTVEQRPASSFSRNDSEANVELMKFCRDAWPNFKLEAIEGFYNVGPGDIVVVRNGKGIGHIFIVGPQKNTLWHCVQGDGVCPTGIGSANNEQVYGAFKLLDKEKWLSKQAC